MNSYLIKQMITGPAEPYRTELLTEIGHDGSFSSQNSLSGWSLWRPIQIECSVFWARLIFLVYHGENYALKQQSFCNSH